ncbi:hypothetical protein B7463_g590, partial [Scytalidium lignicola]
MLSKIPTMDEGIGQGRQTGVILGEMITGSEIPSFSSKSEGFAARLFFAPFGSRTGTCEQNRFWAGVGKGGVASAASTRVLG